MRKYILMHKNIETAVLLFSEDGQIAEMPEILSSEHLPLFVDREKNKKRAISDWWENRSVPKSRKDVKKMLKEQNIGTTGNWLLDNLALSLSDCYWARPFSSDFSWEDVNLYNNSFTPLKVGGIPVKHVDPTHREQLRYTPNASTGGELPKWWFIDNDTRFLLKGSKDGYAIQSRNEIFASLIHKGQGKPYVSYSLTSYFYEGREYIGCQCPTFSSSNLEFVPAFDIISKVEPAKNEPYRQVFVDTCKKNGFTEEKISQYLDYMAITDFLISNYDRHSNNFGIMRDPDTLEFKSFAPFFDSGNSMMFYNLLNCSIGKSLDERNASFFNTWRKTVEHISDLNVVDISKLPTPEMMDKIYPKEELGEKANTSLKHFFRTHIDFLEELRSGKSFYTLYQKYQLKKKYHSFFD